MKSLDEWSIEKDSSLPKICPKCNKKLNQIRYAHVVDRTTIHLTNAINEREWFVAECPLCGNELLRCLRQNRHIR